MTQFSAHDAKMMAIAIRLAEKGQFTTTPNPNVGCVLCDKNGNIVGQGWHKKSGTPHAEVHALGEAGERAKGSTAYVTLEPCSHTGQTPPCADALIKAGVDRVVAAMVDPNPLVSGGGLDKLAAAGISVSHGLLQQQAEQLNRGFIKRMRTGMPWVTVKLASSLDGKTALANGKSQWITGPLARRDVQLHRAKSCAILSGSGTVLADNPSLNVRYDELVLADGTYVQSELRQPTRVILDGRNQLNAKLKLFSLPGDILLINSRKNNQSFPAQVKQWQAAYNQNRLDLTNVFEQIGRLKFNTIWVEAGAKLAGALLRNKLVDELILYQAPKLLGDKGQDMFAVEELTNMRDAYNLVWKDVRQIGDDLKITANITY